jgi:hypothetical protein
MDFGMPLDLVDPSSGLDYFAAADLLENQHYAGVKTGDVAKIPYWENLFPEPLDHSPGIRVAAARPSLPSLAAIPPPNSIFCAEAQPRLSSSGRPAPQSIASRRRV